MGKEAKYYPTGSDSDEASSAGSWRSSSDEEFNDPAAIAGKKLTVMVNHAKNLLAADPNGLSDPYCRLKVGEQVFDTQIHYKTLNPTFHETFEFKIDAAKNGKHVLTIDMFDSDLVTADDFIGRAEVDLTTVEPGKHIPMTLPLAAVDSGELSIEVHIDTVKRVRVSSPSIRSTMGLGTVKNVLQLSPTLDGHRKEKAHEDRMRLQKFGRAQLYGEAWKLLRPDCGLLLWTIFFLVASSVPLVFLPRGASSLLQYLLQVGGTGLEIEKSLIMIVVYVALTCFGRLILVALTQVLKSRFLRRFREGFVGSLIKSRAERPDLVASLTSGDLMPKVTEAHNALFLRLDFVWGLIHCIASLVFMFTISVECTLAYVAVLVVESIALILYQHWGAQIRASRNTEEGRLRTASIALAKETVSTDHHRERMNAQHEENVLKFKGASSSVAIHTDVLVITTSIVLIVVLTALTTGLVGTLYWASFLIQDNEMTTDEIVTFLLFLLYNIVFSLYCANIRHTIHESQPVLSTLFSVLGFLNDTHGEDGRHSTFHSETDPVSWTSRWQVFAGGYRARQNDPDRRHTHGSKAPAVLLFITGLLLSAYVVGFSAYLNAEIDDREVCGALSVTCTGSYDNGSGAQELTCGTASVDLQIDFPHGCSYADDIAEQTAIWNGCDAVCTTAYNEIAVATASVEVSDLAGDSLATVQSFASSSTVQWVKATFVDWTNTRKGWQFFPSGVSTSDGVTGRRRLQTDDGVTAQEITEIDNAENTDATDEDTTADDGTSSSVEVSNNNCVPQETRVVLPFSHYPSHWQGEDTWEGETDDWEAWVDLQLAAQTAGAPLIAILPEESNKRDLETMLIATGIQESVKFLGRVDIVHGRGRKAGQLRKQQQIFGEIDNWIDRGVDGIFVDNANIENIDDPNIGRLYLLNIYNHVHARSGRLHVMQNPLGPFDLSKHEGSADSFVTFVGTAEFFDPSADGSDRSCLDLLWNQNFGDNGAGPFCQWIPQLDTTAQALADDLASQDICAGDTAVFIHSASAASAVPQLAQAAIDNNVGYIFITDADCTSGNCFASSPGTSVLETLLSVVAEDNAVEGLPDPNIGACENLGSWSVNVEATYTEAASAPAQPAGVDYVITLLQAGAPEVVGYDRQLLLEFDYLVSEVPTESREWQIVLREAGGDGSSWYIADSGIDLTDAEVFDGTDDEDFNSESVGVTVPRGIPVGIYDILINFPSSTLSEADDSAYSLVLNNEGIYESSTGFHDLGLQVGVGCTYMGSSSGGADTLTLFETSAETVVETSSLLIDGSFENCNSRLDESCTDADSDSWFQYGEGFALVTMSGDSGQVAELNSPSHKKSAGVGQTVQVNQINAEPLLLAGEGFISVRGNLAVGAAFGLFADIYYSDGTSDWGVSVNFNLDTVGAWEQGQVVIGGNKPISTVWVYCASFFAQGTFHCNDITLTPLQLLSDGAFEEGALSWTGFGNGFGVEENDVGDGVAGHVLVVNHLDIGATSGASQAVPMTTPTNGTFSLSGRARVSGSAQRVGIVVDFEYVDGTFDYDVASADFDANAGDDWQTVSVETTPIQDVENVHVTLLVENGEGRFEFDNVVLSHTDPSPSAPSRRLVRRQLKKKAAELSVFGNDNLDLDDDAEGFTALGYQTGRNSHGNYVRDGDFDGDNAKAWKQWKKYKGSFEQVSTGDVRGDVGVLTVASDINKDKKKFAAVRNNFRVKQGTPFSLDFGFDYRNVDLVTDTHTQASTPFLEITLDVIYEDKSKETFVDQVAGFDELIADGTTDWQTYTHTIVNSEFHIARVKMTLKLGGVVGSAELDNVYAEEVFDLGSCASSDVSSPVSPGQSWNIVDPKPRRNDVKTQSTDVWVVNLDDVHRHKIDQIHESGKIAVCEFKAGVFHLGKERWVEEVPESVLGNSLARADQGERWWDVTQIKHVARPVRSRLDKALRIGCDAVLPSYVDGWAQDTGFGHFGSSADVAASFQGQLDFNLWVANEAHARGLAVGLRNDAPQTADLSSCFEFAVNEGCYESDEGCGPSYSSTFVDTGKAALSVLYDRLRLDTNGYCDAINALGLDGIVKDYSLSTADRIDCTPEAVARRRLQEQLSALASVDTSCDAPINGGSWFKPSPSAKWHLDFTSDSLPQSLDAPVDVAFVHLDYTNAASVAQWKAEGTNVVCAFSAGSVRTTDSDYGFHRADDIGNAVYGDENERWLNVCEVASVAGIVQGRLDTALNYGCDAVLPTRLDGYLADAGFGVLGSDIDGGAQCQLDYNAQIANLAHNRGLGIGLKDDFDQSPELTTCFDFAFAEECFGDRHCLSHTSFSGLGKATFAVEYLPRNGLFTSTASFVDPKGTCPCLTGKFSLNAQFKSFNLDEWTLDCASFANQECAFDLDPPLWATGPEIANVGEETFDLSASIDEDGTIYYFVADSATPCGGAAPSIDDVKDSTACDSVVSGFVTDAAVAVTVDGLTHSTEYFAFFFAEDDAREVNGQRSTTSVSATTTTPPVDPPTEVVPVATVTVDVGAALNLEDGTSDPTGDAAVHDIVFNIGSDSSVLTVSLFDLTNRELRFVDKPIADVCVDPDTGVSDADSASIPAVSDPQFNVDGRTFLVDVAGNGDWYRLSLVNWVSGRGGAYVELEYGQLGLCEVTPPDGEVPIEFEMDTTHFFDFEEGASETNSGSSNTFDVSFSTSRGGDLFLNTVAAGRGGPTREIKSLDAVAYEDVCLDSVDGAATEGTTAQINIDGRVLLVQSGLSWYKIAIQEYIAGGGTVTFIYNPLAECGDTTDPQFIAVTATLTDWLDVDTGDVAASSGTASNEYDLYFTDVDGVSFKAFPLASGRGGPVREVRYVDKAFADTCEDDYATSLASRDGSATLSSSSDRTAIVDPGTGTYYKLALTSATSSRSGTSLELIYWELSCSGGGGGDDPVGVPETHADTWWFDFEQETASDPAGLTSSNQYDFVLAPGRGTLNLNLVPSGRGGPSRELRYIDGGDLSTVCEADVSTAVSGGSSVAFNIDNRVVLVYSGSAWFKVLYTAWASGEVTYVWDAVNAGCSGGGTDPGGDAEQTLAYDTEKFDLDTAGVTTHSGSTADNMYDFYVDSTNTINVFGVGRGALPRSLSVVNSAYADVSSCSGGVSSGLAAQLVDDTQTLLLGTDQGNTFKIGFVSTDGSTLRITYTQLAC